MSDFAVVIPARYASTRLPGKPLRMLAGRPLVAHVCDRARESGASDIVIATDDERIMAVAADIGAEACMTATHHPSGSDRLAEVIEKKGWPDGRIIVNLQGDEPLMPAQLIRQVAEDLASHADAEMATLAARIHTAAELFDPHVVKVVSDRHGYALYFSRAAIPWDRDAFAVTTEQLPESVAHFRHIGLYAYRAGFIRRYVAWPAATIEEMESLEQLRALWFGAHIHVAEATAVPGHGVDTEDDLRRADKILAERGH